MSESKATPKKKVAKLSNAPQTAEQFLNISTELGLHPIEITVEELGIKMLVKNLTVAESALLEIEQAKVEEQLKKQFEDETTAGLLAEAYCTLRYGVHTPDLSSLTIEQFTQQNTGLLLATVDAIKQAKLPTLPELVEDAKKKSTTK